VPPVISVAARGRFSIAARRFEAVTGVIRAVRLVGFFVVVGTEMNSLNQSLIGVR
jgi:hypothetical protein